MEHIRCQYQKYEKKNIVRKNTKQMTSNQSENKTKNDESVDAMPTPEQHVKLDKLLRNKFKGQFNKNYLHYHDSELVLCFLCGL